MNALDIAPDKVSHANVGGTWLRVRGFRPLTLSIAGGKAAPGFEAFDVDASAWLYVLASDLRGVRSSSRAMTLEEVEAERLEAEAQAAADFLRHHRTDKATYDATVAKQSGHCTGCRAALADFAVTHYNGEDGTVLCQDCSPFVHHY